MSYFIKQSAQAQDYAVKSQRLCIPMAIVHNATPALKTYSSDLPADLTLSLQGLTAAAAAIDSGTNFATPTDSTGTFGILLSSLGVIKKLHKSEVVGLSSGTIALSPAGASSSGVTASGNIAISAVWSGSLATTDFSGVLCVDFILDHS